jgi:hypothetical protein
LAITVDVGEIKGTTPLAAEINKLLDGSIERVTLGTH